MPDTHDQILGTLVGHRTQGRVDLEKEAHCHRAHRQYGISALAVLGLDILSTAVCSPLGHSAALGGRNHIVRVPISRSPRPTGVAITGSSIVRWRRGHELAPGAAHTTDAAPERGGAPDIRAPRVDARVPVDNVLPQGAVAHRHSIKRAHQQLCPWRHRKVGELASLVSWSSTALG